MTSEVKTEARFGLGTLKLYLVIYGNRISFEQKIEGFI